MRLGEYTARFHGVLDPLAGSGGQLTFDNLLVESGLPDSLDLQAYKNCLGFLKGILYPDENKSAIDINGYRLLESLQTYSLEIHQMEATCRALIKLRDEDVESAGVDVAIIEVAGRVLRTIETMNAKGPYGDILSK